MLTVAAHLLKVVKKELCAGAASCIAAPCVAFASCSEGHEPGTCMRGKE
jgi:hypothetical protein